MTVSFEAATPPEVRHATCPTVSLLPEGMVPVLGGAIPTSWNLDEVSVPSFAISRHEVTWGEWKAVCASVARKGYDIKSHGAGSADDHPVHSVNWYDAMKWCNAKSEMLGLEPVYTLRGKPYRKGETRKGEILPFVMAGANGFRLPSQVEWEWAARGGRESKGFEYSGSNVLGDVAWYSPNSVGAPCNMSKGHGTWPVGQKSANELGLHDMSGNIWEWCRDAWGDCRVIRGGGWADSADVCAVSARREAPPTTRFYDIGFRLVCGWDEAPLQNALPIKLSSSSPADLLPCTSGASPEERNLSQENSFHIPNPLVLSPQGKKRDVPLGRGMPSALPPPDSGGGAAVPVKPAGLLTAAPEPSPLMPVPFLTASEKRKNEASINPTVPLFLRADANDTVILASQSLAAYLGVEKGLLLGATLESVAERATGELRDCFRRAESGRRLDQLVVDGSSRVFEAKTWSEGGVFDLILDDVTSLQPDELRGSSSIPADDLSEGEISTFRRPDRRTVSVLSSRLIDFSDFIGRTSPIEARLVVGSFLDEASEAVSAFGGTSSARSMGWHGGIFGAPRSFADHALRALNSGLMLSTAMGSLRTSSRVGGREFPMVACGVATGECLVGAFDPNGTNRYSALGAASDIAQQLSGLARPGEVLLTEDCLQQLLANLPKGVTTEELVLDEEPDLSGLRWSGEEVQPLPADKQGRAIALRPAGTDSGPPALVFHYIWSLRPDGSHDAIPILRAELPSAGGTELAVSDRRMESSFLQVFGKYRLVKVVGLGGMGKVWKALDRFGNTLALKTLHQDGDLTPEQRKRFHRESEAMSRLSHRNICRIYEAGEFEGLQYLAMEFVDGLTLAELLSGSPTSSRSKHKGGASDLPGLIRKVRSDMASVESQKEPSDTGAGSPSAPQRLLLPTGLVLTLFSKVCDAVHFAHENGVLHRDLKPGNILLRADGEPLVADFGLAKFTGDHEGHSISVSGHVLGTLANMAPEQAASSKDVDKRADVYSLGTILYMLMTGKNHFQASGSIFSDIQRLQHHVPPSARSVSPRVDADLDLIIGKCLRPSPDDRYQSVQALADDLNLYRRREPILARRISRVEYGFRWFQRHRMAAAIALAIALAIPVVGTAFGLLAVSQREGEADQRVATSQADTAKERNLRITAEAALQKEAFLRREAEAKLRAKEQAGFANYVEGTKAIAAAKEDPLKTATKEAPFENTLGMKLVPVPGTDVLFSVWDTRVKDYAAFVAATSYDAGNGWRNAGFAQTPNDPVVNVSWNDAKAFCQWLTTKDRGEKKIGINQEYRLPTDAEWSVAVGLLSETGKTPKEKDGKVKGVYPWGSQWPPLKGAGNYDWRLSADSFERTSPVGSFPANYFGLYDMGGNVWQWCEDGYSGAGGSPVVRGGSWTNGDPEFLLSSYRNRDYSYRRGSDSGFRCVLGGGSSR